MTSPGEITQLLNRADVGDRDAADRLFRLLERELRAIAGKRKQSFSNAIDASTTALVDDAFCRLVGQNVTTWQEGDRRKFFSYTANKIHDLLVSAARAQAARKRGGDLHRVDLDEGGSMNPRASSNCDLSLLLDLKSALEDLDEIAPEECQVFRFRYFLGATFDEVAAILDISATRAKTLFRKAQLVLRLELKDYQHDA